MPLLPQDHYCNRRDSPRHRIDPKEGGLRHRLTRFQILESHRLQVSQLSTTRYARDRSRNLTLLDKEIQEVGHTLQSLRRHPHLTGLGAREHLLSKNGTVGRQQQAD